MKKPYEYADEEMEFLPESFTDEQRALVRFMIQEAYQIGQREGWEAGQQRNSQREYVPHVEDFKSESDYLIALDGWRRHSRRHASGTYVQNV